MYPRSTDQKRAGTDFCASASEGGCSSKCIAHQCHQCARCANNLGWGIDNMKPLTCHRKDTEKTLPCLLLNDLNVPGENEESTPLRHCAHQRSRGAPMPCWAFHKRLPSRHLLSSTNTDWCTSLVIIARSCELQDKLKEYKIILKL